MNKLIVALWPGRRGIHGLFETERLDAARLIKALGLETMSRSQLVSTGIRNLGCGFVAYAAWNRNK